MYWGKARVIAEHCGPLAEEHTAQVQDLVLPGAGGLSTSELRDVTGQAVMTVDPDRGAAPAREAAARRELALRALPDAMASLNAFLPADGAVKIFQVSDLLATRTAGVTGDSRGIGARRIDALVDIADQLLTYGHLDLSDYLGRELPDHSTPGDAGTGSVPDPAHPDTTTTTDADAARHRWHRHGRHPRRAAPTPVTPTLAAPRLAAPRSRHRGGAGAEPRPRRAPDPRPTPTARRPRTNTAPMNGDDGTA